MLIQYNTLLFIVTLFLSVKATLAVQWFYIYDEYGKINFMFYIIIRVFNHLKIKHTVLPRGKDALQVNPLSVGKFTNFLIWGY